MNQWRNPGKDTYNGAKMLADLSGLSEAEVQWTFDRIKQLKKEGKSKQEAIDIVALESKNKPWV